MAVLDDVEQLIASTMTPGGQNLFLDVEHPFGPRRSYIKLL
jgi:hypothetical protein